MLKRAMTSQLSLPSAVALLAWALAAPACSLGKPDIAVVLAHPTYEVDVHSLLADHCLLCHSYPATRGAPTDFRLDVYTSPDGFPAAYDEAARFIRSIDDGKMPPAAAWGDGVGHNGKAMLQNWQTDGYPP